jgi:hypothetical protein
MNEKLPDEEQSNITPLSPEMHKLLQEESLEAEIQGAIDAAAEEGMQITRDEAIETLLQKNKPEEKSA